MSKKNITEKTKIDNNTMRVTFETDQGHHTYEYKSSSMRAIMRGKDPAGLYGGKLVDFRKKES